MQKIPMLAKQAFTYAGKKLAPGDAFNAAGQSDRRLLTAIGWAEDASEPVPVVVQKVMKAAEKVAAKKAPADAPGTYKRRDMVAQAAAPAPAAAPAAPAVPAPPADDPKPAASTDVGAMSTRDFAR